VASEAFGTEGTISSPSVKTPPYGESYGYGGGYGSPAAPAEDRRRSDGSRGYGQDGDNGAGEGTLAPRQPYPQGNGYPDSFYLGNAYPGGGYPGADRSLGGGYPGNGYRGPYEPRGNDRA
jgi:hypothetical protein